jgi:hypothetical protein
LLVKQQHEEAEEATQTRQKEELEKIKTVRLQQEQEKKKRCEKALEDARIHPPARRSSLPVLSRSPRQRTQMLRLWVLHLPSPAGVLLLH